MIRNEIPTELVGMNHWQKEHSDTILYKRTIRLLLKNNLYDVASPKPILLSLVWIIKFSLH